MRKIKEQEINQILDAVKEFASHASHVNEWIVVKKHVVNSLPSTIRVFFSRRHEKTKLQHPNELEYELMRYWAALTGNTVIFKDNGTEGKIDPP